jgi:predicted GNAT family acetyltransferase
MSIAIRHESAQQRFETVVEGQSCVLDYVLDDLRSPGVMTITHTVVPGAVGGRGIAGALVQAALEQARAEGWKVLPACSYADAWMRRHPQYEELRVG